MERVTGCIRVENLVDRSSGDRVRTLHIDSAVIDPGVSTLGLPARLIRELGFEVSTSSITGRAKFGPVRLWIGDRDMATDVVVVPDQSPVLVGKVALGYLQIVVDPATHALVPSPANGGEWVLDMF